MSIEAVSNEEIVFSEIPKEEFELKPSDKFFSREFTVLEKNWPQAVISTNRYFHGFNLFDWRTHYTLTDANTGKMIAEAVKNYGILSFQGMLNGSFLGLFKGATLADFDVYDAEGAYVGFIDGNVFTTSKAYFQFKDHEGTTKSYAKEEESQIFIRDQTSNGVVGYMRREIIPQIKDSWMMKIKDGVDQRVALIFAAFIVDNQAYFLKDN
ncbi:MAG: hypothetical protein H7A38_03785 [Chlamydiales bacterium]|nr:hypothetical protein [Chlamydiales bacterium]